MKIIDKPFIRFIITLIYIFLIAYFLNFFWETIHAAFLYENHDTFPALFYVRMVSYAASIDALLILLIYGINLLIFRDFLWVKKLNLKKSILACISGILIAAWIEHQAILLEKWAYNSLMPTALGLGISPLLQLAVTGIITFLLTQKILFGKGEFYEGKS